jgi:hypothetical protein
MKEFLALVYVRGEKRLRSEWRLGMYRQITCSVIAVGVILLEIAEKAGF